MRAVSPAEPMPCELELLGIPWTRRPSAVQKGYEALNAQSSKVPTQRTAVLKLFQVMLVGPVNRGSSLSLSVYEAASGQEYSESELIRGLINHDFEGSSKGSIVRALNGASYQELERTPSLTKEAKGSGSV